MRQIDDDSPRRKNGRAKARPGRRPSPSSTARREKTREEKAFNAHLKSLKVRVEQIGPEALIEIEELVRRPKGVKAPLRLEAM